MKARVESTTCQRSLSPWLRLPWEAAEGGLCARSEVGRAVVSMRPVVRPETSNKEFYPGPGLLLCCKSSSCIRVNFQLLKDVKLLYWCLSVPKSYGAPLSFKSLMLLLTIFKTLIWYWVLCMVWLIDIIYFPWL